MGKSGETYIIMAEEKAVKVSISRYLKEIKAFLKKYHSYIDDLDKINAVEDKAVDKMPYPIHRERWDKYCEQYMDKVLAAEKARKALKEKYGKYSSLYGCPYYCVITKIEQLERVPSKNEDNYMHWKADIEKWHGKMVQSNRKCEWGRFVGLAFFIDNVYFLFKNPITGQEYISFEIYNYDKWDHRDWRVVENGKDYI